MSRTKTLNFEGKNVIEIKVKPGSKTSSVEFDKENNIYIFFVKSQAEDGKANAEVLKILKKEAGREGRIISGATSRKKLIKLE